MSAKELSPDEVDHLEKVKGVLVEEILRSGGTIGFDHYMELVLYGPGIGYYTSGTQKLGDQGDFITAPEISPVFGRCVANQCQQVLSQMGEADILEFGAGTGQLAVDILSELQRQNALPRHYKIMELSPDLRDRQSRKIQQDIPELADRVMWLDRLEDDSFRGVVIANEVLDAMPVHKFRIEGNGIQESFVKLMNDSELAECWLPAHPGLADHVSKLREKYQLADGYISEVNLRLSPWFKSLAQAMSQGAVFLVDYGYTGRDYYFPERREGTLIGHFRHEVTHDPLQLPGLQDITSNVDFTAVAEAATSAGFTLGGYTTQAHFLMGTGLDKAVMDSDPNNVRAHMDLVQGIKKLTLPGEMGERFKVIGLQKDMQLDLMGFASRDLRDRL